MNEVFNRLVLEITSNIVVELVDIDDFNCNNVLGRQMVTGMLLTRSKRTMSENG